MTGALTPILVPTFDMTEKASSTTSDEWAWLLKLSAWLSPSYPVGAFAYSQGLEWAVEARLVTDARSAAGYIETVLKSGGGWIDQLLLAAAWRAARQRDLNRLEELADLAMAWRGTAEALQESVQMGSSFVLATRAAWPGTRLDDLAARRPGQIPYAVALGAAGGDSIPLAALVPAFAQSVAANLVSAAIRLVPLGQTAGQQALADLMPAIGRIAEMACCAELDSVTTAAPLIDLASMRHETQYSRLFRS